MGCWSISDFFAKIVVKILPESVTGSSATYQYVMANIFFMLLTMVLVLTLNAFYTDLVLKYQVSGAVLQGIVNAVSQNLDYLFKSQSNYMVQNFRYVVKAADYYVSPLYGYVGTLVEKADLDEVDNTALKKYGTWFLQILTLFFLTNLLIFVWSHVAKI